MWCTVRVSSPSRRLERPPASPAAHGTGMVIAARVELARPRLRAVLLHPLCIRDQIFGLSARTEGALTAQRRVCRERLRHWLRVGRNGAGTLANRVMTVWCSVLESNQAGPQRTPGLQPGRGPSPSNATFGAQCRLSACDLRFVGPLLFTSELTGRTGDLQGHCHPLTR